MEINKWKYSKHRCYAIFSVVIYIITNQQGVVSVCKRNRWGCKSSDVQTKSRRPVNDLQPSAIGVCTWLELLTSRIGTNIDHRFLSTF